MKLKVIFSSSPADKSGNSRDQSGKPFRGNSAGGSSSSGHPSGSSGGSGQQASRDRYPPSRKSVSSTATPERCAVYEAEYASYDEEIRKHFSA